LNGGFEMWNPAIGFDSYNLKTILYNNCISNLLIEKFVVDVVAAVDVVVDP
jgi:hypothetical protein